MILLKDLFSTSIANLSEVRDPDGSILGAVIMLASSLARMEVLVPMLPAGSPRRWQEAA